MMISIASSITPKQIVSNHLTALLIAVSALGITSTVALAKDGNAYGGYCFVKHITHHGLVRHHCSVDGVSCEGNGRGGVKCSVGGQEGVYRRLENRTQNLAVPQGVSRVHKKSPGNRSD